MAVGATSVVQVPSPTFVALSLVPLPAVHLTSSSDNQVTGGRLRWSRRGLMAVYPVRPRFGSKERRSRVEGEDMAEVTARPRKRAKVWNI